MGNSDSCVETRSASALTRSFTLYLGNPISSVPAFLINLRKSADEKPPSASSVASVVSFSEARNRSLMTRIAREALWSAVLLRRSSPG